MQTIECSVENAPKFIEWCKSRGGVARWRSVNLSNPGASWSTPALTLEGLPTPKPTWQADSAPELVESDPAKITVFMDREVRRLRVAIKRGDSFNFVLTDASTRKVRKATAEAGPEAYYRFDYDSQEAVIMAPDSKMTLAQWAERQTVAA